MAHKSHHRKRRLFIAQDNQFKRALRSIQQQLDLIATRPGNSAKEIAKLAAQQKEQ